MNASQLVAAAHRLGVALSLEQAAQLVVFAQLLRKWNKTFNLVSRRDIERLEQRHILDSLSALPLLRGERVLDVGSGAGLPGLVLAIAEVGRHFTLCDRHARRTRFLHEVVRRLSMENVTIVQSDVADIDAKAQFDSVLCRGVATAPIVWDMVHPLLDQHGCIILFESTQDGQERQQAEPQEAKPEESLEFHPDIRTIRHRVEIPGINIPHTLLQMERR